MTRPRPKDPCPCGRGAAYAACCRPQHRGAAPADPESLMRARYAAYAVGDVGFLQATTDPAGPHHRGDPAAWAEELRAWCRSTRFVGLRVDRVGLDRRSGLPTVRFFATLTRDGADASFGEESRFRRVGGRWVYVDGTPWSG